LVEKGEIAETAGSELVNQFIAYTKQACIPFWINEKTIENKFGELGFPTQREFRLLSQQIDDLNQKIALLNPAKENEQTNEKQIFD
jgi:hypothetical protein